MVRLKKKKKQNEEKNKNYRKNIIKNSTTMTLGVNDK